ncbi:hypothetical protein RDI58_006283 [Solanum bulbocastanum]|uniref:Transmembrane protein n=1 Tax=Solanum bulbocastanum TaxID=147425 RepID=A0AAN8YN99_SOLBU
MTGMSSRPAIVEETSSSYSPPVKFVPHLFFTKSDSSENHNSKFVENKPAQRTQSQPFLVPDNFVKLNSCQDNLQPRFNDLKVLLIFLHHLYIILTLAWVGVIYVVL